MRAPGIAAVALVMVSGVARAEHGAPASSPRRSSEDSACRAPAGALLSNTQANQVAATYAGEVQRCYFRHALVESAASGRVRVDLDVKRDGKVERVRVVAPGISRLHFERCVVARALTWRFPASSASTEVRMPFWFQVPLRLRAAPGQAARRSPLRSCRASAQRCSAGR